jgi:hypothetical protein
MSIGSAIATAGIVAGAGAVGGGAISAIAAGDAGNKQYTAAQQQLQFAQQALTDQINARSSGIAQAQTAAQMSPQEISSINQMLTTQTSSLSASLNSISTMQNQLNAMSPQVQAAGQDYYNLLTGQSAAILAPLQQQQTQQRNQLMDQLAGTMGPGFMSSSAGIQALTNFDNQSAITLNNAQMNAIQTVGSQYMAGAGMQEQGQYGVGAQIQGAYGQSIATTQAAAGAYASNTALQTNATLGAMSANPLNPFGVSTAAGAVTAAAPGTSAGTAMIGQGVGNALGGFGGTLASGANAATFGNALAGLYGTPSTGSFGSNISSAAGAIPMAGAYTGAYTGGYNGNFGASLAPAP